ncbi:carcinoembryonic antigen-related cell adhesion molecule 1 isoform X3 [Cyprinus carpio]|uniref:Carcinoembryonic antigen-related cell adhesion molecule 1 isoform X3 n=1 Tax=Cyprinus carpio TaxID=7962 RepID=A0A9R0AWZ5_CYPCA|nr:carcinoembryonic antigen-related cell adhesion molecule 1 isoform X3 [Cyprinus carpio]
MGHKLLILFFTLICTSGLYAVFLVPSQNPVAVGSNITISVNDTEPIIIGLWLFGPSTLFMWYPEEVLTGSGHQNGTEFNSSTYQLTLSSVTLKNSGLYVLDALKPRVRAEITLDVQEPVSNLTAFVSMTNLVEFNDTVTFTCSASGTPVWFSWKNGSSTVTAGGRVDLRNGGREFIISGVTRYDEGPFTCLVANNISKAESGQMNLNISYGPSNLKVTASPEKSVYISGSDISLSCSADSKPTASFYWMYNGNPLNVYGPSYDLRGATQNRTGEYTCVAQNAVTMQLNVKVTKKIDIVDPISAVTVNPAGSPVENMAFNLSCNVVGPVKSIQWMKNGGYLDANNMITFSNDNSTLRFNQLTLSDDGQYQCAASNAVSNMTSPAYNLMVNYGPNNTAASGSNIAAVGSSVTFSCSSDSRPQSQYKWYFSGLNVKNGSVYVTTPLSKSDSGQYTCMAFNSITGRSSDASVTLTVYAPVSNVTVNMDSQQPIFSQPFTLTCTVIGDVQHIQWMKNGVKLYQDNRISFTNNNSVLNFNPLTLSDNGQYQCEASNVINNMTSEAYDLNVFYGPWNTTVEGPIMAEMGSNVTFNCTAISRPHSQYSWFHNTSKVGDGPVHVTSVLSLDSSGRYTCMAINDITGSSSNASLELTVIETIATVEVIPDRTIPLASQSFQLTCNVKGPYNTLHWLRNNQNFLPSGSVIFSANNTSVTFKTLQTADEGRYQCVASNALKQYISHPYDLVVIFGPQSVQIIVRPGIPPVLKCQAVSQPPAVYHWIFENNTVVGNESSIELPIKSIMGSNYTCVAKNPLTNVTVYTSQVVSNPNAAVGVQASVMLTALFALLLPVLEEWF